jgi:hypothetical protein
MSDKLRHGVETTGVGDEPTPSFSIEVNVIDLAPCSRCKTWTDITDGDFLLCAECEEKVRKSDEFII